MYYLYRINLYYVINRILFIKIGEILKNNKKSFEKKYFIFSFFIYIILLFYRALCKYYIII